MKAHHDAQAFTRELIEAVQQDVDRNIQDFPDEDCVAFTREFLFLMEKWQPEAIDLANEPLAGAAHGLYLSMLFRHCFERAYLHSNRFVIAKESLEKAFEKSDD